MSSSYASQSKPIYWIKSTMLSQWSDIFLLEAFEFHETGVVVEWAVWQYGLWSFQTRGTKLERFLPKNQHILKEIFES